MKRLVIAVADPDPRGADGRARAKFKEEGIGVDTSKENGTVCMQGAPGRPPLFLHVLSRSSEEAFTNGRKMQLPALDFRDVRPQALIAGALVDNVATMFIMLLLMTALASKGISQDEFVSRMQSPSGLLLGLIIGLGCTLLGGYVAGRMARRAEVLHGALVALIGVVLALIWRESGLPNRYDIAGFVGMLPAGMLGGRMARQRRQSRDGLQGQDRGA